MTLKSKYVAADPSTPAGRVRWVLEKLFGGSQSRMAAAFGLSQAAISNVLRGQRIPGREMLMVIGSHPLLSLSWMLTGDGEPIEKLDEKKSQADALPIVDRPLPSSPGLSRSLLSGEHYPTARHFVSPTRYWLRVQPVHLAHLPDDPDVRPGVMLLIETDKSLWRANVETLNGRVTIVCAGRGADRGPTLYRTAVRISSDKKHTLSVMRLVNPFESAKRTRRIVPEGVDIKPSSEIRQSPPDVILKLKDVVAIALQAVSRMWP